MSRVLVIGAGAIGSYLAARLAAWGAEVTVAARGRRLAELRERGIELLAEGRREVRRVSVIAPGDPAPPAELAILCTKMPDLGAALAILRPLAGPGLAVLTTQNGVDAPDLAAVALPGAAVIASRIHGFFELEQGAVRHVGVPPSLVLGAWNDAQAELATRLADVLASSGIPATTSEDIRAALWRKLVLAGPLGGSAALLGIAAGRMKEDPANWDLFAAAVAEAVAVARAEGVTLPGETMAETLAFAASFPAEATTSLQRDLASGRPSEFDALVGTVLRRGRAHGLAVPVHARIAARFAPDIPNAL